MEYFIFNNYNSKELDIIVKEMPPISRAEKNVEVLSVNGRNGNLYIDNETYKSKQCTINCILKDTSKIDLIKSIYLGKGILELSTEPNREYSAIITNKIDISKYLNYLKEFPLTFDLEPIAYSKEEKKEIITKTSEINVGGSIKTYPKIIITGVGIITVNNMSVEVFESDITIDCRLMNCTNNGINKNNKVVLEEFPYLNNGSNQITLGSGILAVEIIYKEGWL